MRMLLALAVAFVLAVPAVAAADRSPSGPTAGAAAPATGVTQSKKNKKNKKQKKQKKAKKQRQRQSASQSTGSVATGEIEVTGPLTSLDPPTVGGVACVVPAGKTVTGVAVGDIVEMKCVVLDGTLTLRRFEREDDAGELEAKGAVQALAPLTVAGIACAVPTGMSIGDIQIGDFVEMKCVRIAGVWTVKRVEPEDDDNDNRGPGNGDDDDDDRSGPGGGGDDNSGRGGGGDDD